MVLIRAIQNELFIEFEPKVMDICVKFRLSLPWPPTKYGGRT